MNSSSQPVWRSLLYVPAHVPRFVASAAASAADALILDLEDSVPPACKAAARDGLADAVPALQRLAVGAVLKLPPFEEPQTPLTGVGEVEAVSVA